ncbi:hypothetical protein BHE74_00003203 [Ensete ventricosum]|nr:hypothetical protein BHE74_00003203 [Ensete ventricosum]
MQCERVIRRNHALSFSRKGILHCFLSVAKKSPSHKASMGGKQRLPPVIMTNSWRAGRGSRGVAPLNPSDFGSPLTSSSRALSKHECYPCMHQTASKRAPSSPPARVEPDQAKPGRVWQLRVTYHCSSAVGCLIRCMDGVKRDAFS